MIKNKKLELSFRAFDDGLMVYHDKVNPILVNNNQHLEQFFKVIREDAIIMQYIGVKDKNGKKIYDGDIILCKEAVEPEEKGFVCVCEGFYVYFYNVNFPGDSYYSAVDLKYIENRTEIIGNIYENPNLLKL